MGCNSGTLSEINAKANQHCRVEDGFIDYMEQFATEFINKAKI